MNIVFTKDTEKYGHLKCIRDDKSATETKMPEQGVAPHDMIHFVVEKNFSIKGAFYGQLKAGADISFKLEHNELSREVADRIDVWQTESMVESLQSLLWSGGKPDYDNFIYLTEQACNSRNIPFPHIPKTQFNDMVLELLSLNERWKNLSQGQSISVSF
ncbi:cytoplasmic protein [Shewanella sp. AS16]|uniref:cytoplasmic protein n=1 Tax=Shewanella sp. AS16 TaxID=2907625 RepID=UPI001F3A4E2D|nr:cytoplasmic protein [Shewanella sp. AS16]MCE9686346.1 cytoplasmic protein [Shewanella sp. AS16]